MRVPLTAPWLWLVASWLGACLVACGGGLTVHGEVVRPARVPVRAFPRIVVTTTDGGASDPLADTLAGHLEDRSEVRRAQTGTLRSSIRLASETTTEPGPS
ncbi:MAG: hypothetical protein K8H88_12095 [Sandaracinaceae bacterium]|nr:hypothetical protein [Sandaracinaceae bacterium]